MFKVFLRSSRLLGVVGKLRLLRWRLFFKPAPVQDTVTPDMVPQPLEGYTDRLCYAPGQTVTFHLKALQENNLLLLQYRTPQANWQTLHEHSFDLLLQQETLEEAQHGCNWTPSWTFTLPAQTPQGYYRAFLNNRLGGLASEIHFLVSSPSPSSEVAVLAPVSTWQAYNAYAGQSLYRNAVAAEAVPYVSTLRPNTALTYHRTTSHQHDLQIESHLYHWFAEKYQADLLPDYFLEAHPQRFQSYKVIVLAYHAEYFTQKMYHTLKDLVQRKKISLIALGGNQLYWQVRWHNSFTQLECRKDGAFFEHEPERGCLWRHTSAPEATLLGAQFSEAGMNSYAPYQVLTPEHWLFSGSHVTRGQLFGEKGLDGLPICGDETDKTTWCSPANTVVLAKGLNKAATSQERAVYQPGNKEWNGEGGGEITVTELSPQHAVLNSGSIQSGAGVGVDAVFTQVITNFMHRYARTSSGGTTS
ncbi:N,N-dimethylformamidase beta subunit family domain-containing protein [Rufibacter quisquiliarum]|uniref:N,N-dimethylformamidase beta subunit-like C-terminal domain-containing protein n=1 Tax=Rufibacter quisquiliarum TaxID=1549639 RepID=A0A839GNT4_9BACT|nr:N,N-dimethylformamidase beta subunit family domain-containing protein [Rufibacter quisquiliarum]MBA9075501.1 hypothetical protein [Rufibacter quisquiliarum]